VASKFRLADGTMINLLDNEWSEEKDGKRVIRQDKFDKELFHLTSFRIPTTGISSGSQIEIVGFLPHTSGDLMILPGNITKQKGLDFDVDKENTYQYHHILSNGKFEKLDEKHKTETLAKADKLKGLPKEEITAENRALFDAIFGEDVTYEAPILMGKIYEAIEDTILSLQKEQKQAWSDMGIIESKDGKIVRTNFIDAKYINKFNGTPEERVDMALLDSIVNQMIHLANSFMVFGGDPAMYFKSDAKRSSFKTEQEYLTQLAKDTFTNAGKRLANQIAPGIKLAESDTEQYLHLLRVFVFFA